MSGVWAGGERHDEQLQNLRGPEVRGQGTSILVTVLKFSRSKVMEGGESDEGVRWETS